MKYAIFSDIHGNLEALEAVLDALKSENVDAYYCLGDVVGYGANPQECINLVQKTAKVCIAGNHDWASIGKIDISYFNPIAKQAILWTKDHLRKEDVQYLTQLGLLYRNNDFILVHGTLHNPEEFIYLTDIEQAFQSFELMNKPLCFLGHTHVPEIIVQEGSNIFYAQEKELVLKPSQKYIINVGSVGQPRDGNPLASYAVYHSEQNQVLLKRVPYKLEQAQEKIIQAGLPQFLAYRLAIGH